MESNHWQKMQAEFARMFAKTPVPAKPEPMPVPPMPIPEFPQKGGSEL